MAFLLADLGVTKSHSRPHVSNYQPLKRSAVQDSQVPAAVSPAIPLLRRPPRPLPAVLTGITTTTATPALPTTRPPMSTTAERRPAREPPCRLRRPPRMACSLIGRPADQGASVARWFIGSCGVSAAGAPTGRVTSLVSGRSPRDHPQGASCAYGNWQCCGLQSSA